MMRSVIAPCGVRTISLECDKNKEKRKTHPVATLRDVFIIAQFAHECIKHLRDTRKVEAGASRERGEEEAGEGGCDYVECGIRGGGWGGEGSEGFVEVVGRACASGLMESEREGGVGEKGERRGRGGAMEERSDAPCQPCMMSNGTASSRGLLWCTKCNVISYFPPPSSPPSTSSST